MDLKNNIDRFMKDKERQHRNALLKLVCIGDKIPCIKNGKEVLKVNVVHIDDHNIYLRLFHHFTRPIPKYKFHITSDLQLGINYNKVEWDG